MWRGPYSVAITLCNLHLPHHCMFKKIVSTATLTKWLKVNILILCDLNQDFLIWWYCVIYLQKETFATGKMKWTCIENQQLHLKYQKSHWIPVAYLGIWLDGQYTNTTSAI